MKHLTTWAYSPLVSVVCLNFVSMVIQQNLYAYSYYLIHVCRGIQWGYEDA